MGSSSSKSVNPKLQALAEKNNTCPENAKIIHTTIKSLYSPQSVSCDKNGTITAISKEGKYTTWSLLDKSDDSIIDLQPKDNGKPRNFQFTPTNCTHINVSSNGKKVGFPDDFVFGSPFSKNRKYLILNKWHEWIMFIPVDKLNESVHSNKSYNIDMIDGNNYIDQTKFEQYMIDGFSFHNIGCYWLYNDEDKYVIYHKPTNNWRYINFYIFSCKTHKLIQKIENKIWRPNNYNSKFNENISRLSITDQSISFWTYPTAKFEYDKDFKLTVTEYSELSKIQNIYAILSPSNKYLIHSICTESEQNKFQISSLEDRGILKSMYDFEIDVSQGRLYNMYEKFWYNDDILIGYNRQSIFIFQTAISNIDKKMILFEKIGSNDLVDIILEMIGFELNGSWLCHYIDLYAYHQERSRRGIVRNVDIAIYFGKYKKYAFITAYNCGLKTVVVELDYKYSSLNCLREIELN